MGGMLEEEKNDEGRS